MNCKPTPVKHTTEPILYVFNDHFISLQPYITPHFCGACRHHTIPKTSLCFCRAPGAKEGGLDPVQG